VGGEEAATKKVYARLTARHVQKFREVTFPCLKVIGGHTLNFKRIFECLSSSMGTKIR